MPMYNIFNTTFKERDNTMNELTVTAAIIKNNDGEILICQRADNASMGGMWEFPGGKLEKHETLEDCIIRECREELSVAISIEGIFAQIDYQYPDKLIHFTFFNASIIDGGIKMKVHQSIKWTALSDIKSYKFCPADIDILDMLINKKIND